MTNQWFAWIFENFSLVMLILALVVSFFYAIFSSLRITENIFRWVAFFALGFTGIYTFILHAFFPAISAANIGWVPSPFQYEVAVADLTIGILGICCFKASTGFRTATTLAAIIWLWGDAIGHIQQMIIRQNFTLGNAGSWFWIDIIVPLILLIMLLSLKKQK